MNRCGISIHGCALIAAACLSFVAADAVRAGADRGQERGWSVEDVLCFPADSEMIQWMAREFDMEMMGWKMSYTKGSPACNRDLIAKIESHYEVSRFKGDAHIDVLWGGFDRAAVEKCLPAILGLEEPRVTCARDGSITEVSTQTGTKRYLGWSQRGFFVWHEDRKRVQDFLSEKTSLRTNEDMLALLERIGRTPSPVLWIASTFHPLEEKIGIQLRGSTFVASKAAGKRETTYLFESEARARAAIAVMREKAKGKGPVEPFIQEILSVEPTVEGESIVLEVQRAPGGSKFD
ncbi:MAG: hypothetical protein JXR96_20640 [Deltaproteobacteria bacterium]|nr:hypothetical protein [Deltaproteobacteria bacterium]